MASTFRAFCLASLALAVPTFAGAASGAVLHVPGEYPTIQAAVDAAGLGDVVQLAKGTFTENVAVSGRSDLEIRGSGKKTKWRTDVDDALLVEGCVGITIRKIEFRAAASAIVVQTSAFVVVDRCRFLGGERGVGLFGTTDSTVQRSLFRWEPSAIPENQAGVGVDLDDDGSQDSHDCVVSRNEFRGAEIAVNQALGTLRTTVVDNDVRDGAFGVEARAGSLVAGNRIAGMTSLGILAADSGASIVENEVRDVAMEALRIGGADHLVAANQIAKSGAGILLVGSADGAQVISNHVEKTVGDGIDVFCDDSTFVENTVWKAGASGLHLRGAGHVVLGNAATKSGAFDLTDEVGGNLLVGNEFSSIAP